MEGLRKLPFLLACLCILLVVGIELSSGFLKSGPSNAAAFASRIAGSQAGQKALEGLNPDEKQDFLNKMTQVTQENQPPGVGIKSLALLDIIILFNIAIIALSIFLPEHLMGKLEGIGSLIFAIILIIVSFISIILLLIRLILMVSLFLSAPFGTIAYLVLWGFFNTGTAGALLSIIMLLKIGFSISLAASQQQFLKNKGLILLVLTSLLANLIVSFLQGIVPFVLVSITDDLAAIIVGILALIWAVVVLVASIIGVVMAITTR